MVSQFRFTVPSSAFIEISLAWVYLPDVSSAEIVGNSVRYCPLVREWPYSIQHTLRGTTGLLQGGYHQREPPFLHLTRNRRCIHRSGENSLPEREHRIVFRHPYAAIERPTSGSVDHRAAGLADRSVDILPKSIAADAASQ